MLNFNVDPASTEEVLKYHTFYNLFNQLEDYGTCLGNLAEESGPLRWEGEEEDPYANAPKEKYIYINPSDAQISSLRLAIKNAYKSFEFAFNLGDTELHELCLQIKSADGTLVDCDGYGELNINKIKEQCSPAPFGDLKTMTTKVDPDVRSGLTIDYDRIVFYKKPSWNSRSDPKTPVDHHKQELLKLLERVQDEFQDDTLYLEPYKLNVYEVGGHFKPHKDTPRYPNMVGTMVVRLRGAHEGGKLVVRHGGETFTEKNSATAFFCDREHEITPVIEGYRVALTYNICKENESVRKTKLAITLNRTKPLILDHNIASLIKHIKRCPFRQIGILTEFDYTQKGISLKSLKGNDKVLLEELSKEPSFTIDLLPVVVSQHYTDDSSSSHSTYYLHGEVYRFLTEDMERMIRGEKVPKTDKPGTVFFWNKKGLEVYKHKQIGAEHTGNESMADAIDNIYFNAAIMLTNTNAKETTTSSDMIFRRW